MRVNHGDSRPRSSARARWATRADGFTLLEAVIAAGLVLLTVTAVTAFVTFAAEAGRRTGSAVRADRAVASVAERLRSLPYCAAAGTHSAPGSGVAEARDLVAAVFPHARPEANVEVARFVAVDESDAPAGSFVSRSVQDGMTVLCVARFRGADGRYLGCAEVLGFDCTAARPPGPELEVQLSAGGRSMVRTWRLLRRAGVMYELDAGEI